MFPGCRQVVQNCRPEWSPRRAMRGTALPRPSTQVQCEFSWVFFLYGRYRPWEGLQSREWQSTCQMSFCEADLVFRYLQSASSHCTLTDANFFTLKYLRFAIRDSL